MLQVEIIGNLGADAHEESVNGSSFLSFNVAHRDTWVSRDGMKHEQTTWVSCAMGGNYQGVKPFLVKGKSVYVQGRLSARVYSSPKERKMVAGLNCAVDKLELIGGKIDDIPAQLYTGDGVLVNVHKASMVNVEDAKSAGASDGKLGVLMNAQGREFHVNEKGFVSLASETTSNSDSNSNDDADEVF